MELVNETKFAAGWTSGFARDGRELLIVAVKGTFTFDEADEETRVAEEQAALTEFDTFTGEPGLSAVLTEVDYAHHKPACDVLLNGSAHAPQERPSPKVTVSLQVGDMKKSFDVVGDREWDAAGFLGYRVTPSKPFTRMPITYDRAFGGADKDPADPAKVATYGKNPVGVGYYPVANEKDLVGRALPNTEESGRPATARNGSYEPMSFGPLGRNFASRYPLAGTYDQAWLDSKAPFWPDNFDYAYFQATPRDQQIPYPHGGEEVVLRNLTPRGHAAWRLPAVSMPFAIVRRNKEPEVRDGVVDTLAIESDAGRFSMTWRMVVPLKRDCFEIAQIIAGRASVRSLRPSTAAKPRFRSIDELVQWKKERGR